MKEFYISFDTSDGYEICNTYIYADDMEDAISQAKDHASSLYKTPENMAVYEVDKMEDDSYEGKYVPL